MSKFILKRKFTLLKTYKKIHIVKFVCKNIRNIKIIHNFMHNVKNLFKNIHNVRNFTQNYAQYKKNRWESGSKTNIDFVSIYNAVFVSCFRCHFA